MSEQQQNPTSTSAEQAKRDLLGTGASRRWWQRTTVWLGVAALVVAAGGVYAWSKNSAAKAAPQFVSQPAVKGDITLTVMANGTLQPTRSVTIGSELSGTVARVLVDVNDHVKKGQVLVELDPTKLRSQVERSRASLASAQAKLAEANATAAEAEASLKRLQEVHRISGGKVPAASEMDTGKATLDRAIASQNSASASVRDAKAALASDETNLSKASVVSPIDGVVLTRAVEPGNAVAASLQAVTLFTLAEDLSQLRLDVNVDEADVGSVQQDQSASFTVSAWPGRSFPAKVARVAFGSTTTDNVVTYTTRLNVNNEDRTLRPGMTASATIVSTQRKDVLLVPNAALRFTPSGAAAGAPAPASGPSGAGGDKAKGSGGSGGGIMGQLMPRPPRMGGGSGKGGDEPALPAGERRIWVDEGGTARPVLVHTGISDGRSTEVTGDQLQPGMRVITDQRVAGAKGAKG
ncbi:efflux RND transporter periplasmic adaptor subunit [Diaphorobacter caeni]|uniref:efflux RND transporter periplasmic adaptor subunit n=1 Tax=Diaphorobacter caeni TaxID=2784387 RepID=UPI00188F4CB9|nr:efflux RND transporter periplasmic adaptor subunit [Diaphorobacter caeni]MBF5006455.1 efflux RND transporter periplasmic adaptor subunit [Diaphorobacter caeni]